MKIKMLLSISVEFGGASPPRFLKWASPHSSAPPHFLDLFSTMCSKILTRILSIIKITIDANPIKNIPIQ